MNKSTQAKLSPGEVQERHDRWNRNARLRRFQRSRAAAAGMTWEQWEDHKRRLREMPKSSRAEYLRNYRATPRGKQVFRDANRRVQQRQRSLYESLKKGRPCQDCGGLFHLQAMEWDHRDGATKSFDVSYVGRGGKAGPDLLLSEIAKCDLVCANCHRVRTARRRQGLPATLPPPDYEI